MGRFSIICGVAALLVASGCRDAGAAPLRKSRRDVVTFELGGDGPTLAELLRRSAHPPRGPETVEVPDPGDLSDGPARKFREVRLAPGQTLSQLCEAELGSSDRWREVARLNGWSEDEVSMLPSNVTVKLPPE